MDTYRTWLENLYFASGALTIITNIIVLYLVFPAFKRTRERGFLFLFYAFMIGTFDTICNHTIGLQRMGPGEYFTYRTVRYLTYMGVTVLDATGLVLIARSYLRLSGADAAGTIPALPSNSEPPAVANPAYALTCPFCKTEWELDEAEMQKPEFHCTVCNRSFPLQH